MPKQLRSVYAGGYSDEKKRRLQNYQLPPKIKCAVCHKLKAVNFFSSIQQLELRNGMATGQVGNAAVEEWIPCVACTPKQVMELQCCICDEVKDLTGFAKTQRRLGENAKCIICMAMLNGETPIEGSYFEHLKEKLREDSDDSDSDDDASSSNAHEDSTFSASGSGAEIPCSSISGYDLDKEDLGSLSLSSNDYNSKPSASQASSTSMMATKRARVPVGVSKWQSFTSENKGKAVESTKGTEFTGFDRDGKAHQMIRPASTVDSDDDSDDDSDGTVADPREEARKAKEEREAKSRFAKVPAGPPAPIHVPTYVGGKTVPSAYDDDDDDGDDDWGTI